MTDLATRYTHVSQPLPPQRPPYLDPNLAIAQLAAAEGDLYLAAERLHLTREDGPATILRTISEHPDCFSTLATQLRIQATIKAFRDMTTVQTAIIDALQTFEPPDIVRAYKALVDLFTSTTNPQAQGGTTFNLNSNNTTTSTSALEVDKLLAVLPADVREAVRVLSTPNPNSKHSGAVPPSAQGIEQRTAQDPSPCGGPQNVPLLHEGDNA